MSPSQTISTDTGHSTVASVTPSCLFSWADSIPQVIDGGNHAGGQLLLANRSGCAFPGVGLAQRYQITNTATHLYAALITYIMPPTIAVAYDPYSVQFGWSVPTTFKGAKVVEGFLPRWLRSLEAFLHWWLAITNTILNPDIRAAMNTLSAQVR